MNLFVSDNHEIMVDKLPETNVVIIYICHTSEIVNEVLKDEAKKGSYIIFVGNNSIDNELLSNDRIIIARNLKHNIEDEKYLLAFTAWYLIVYNNLFTEYEYICILEYDVTVESEFHNNLHSVCVDNIYDIITFFPLTYYLVHSNITTTVLQYFLMKKNIEFKILDTWYATSNQCMKRQILCDFVHWYYPECKLIKQLDPFKISWYHERIFSCFLYEYENKYNIFVLGGIEHFFLKSHESYKLIEDNEMPTKLINLFIENINCEFLNKVFEYYQLFSSIINNDHAYYCLSKWPSYFSNLDCINYIKYNVENYEKQKELFEISKTCNHALIIDNYTLHTAFIMLIANPTIHITCIEQNDQRDMENFMLLNKYFDTDIRYIGFNDSISCKDILPTLTDRFDLLHISKNCIISYELDSMSHICKQTTLDNFTIIVDNWDTYFYENIRKFIQNDKIINDKLVCVVQKMKIMNISKT